MGKNKKSKNKNNPTIHSKRYIEEKARTLPIGKCYISSDWEQTGLASILVTRIRPSGNLIVGSYLVDTYCLGVKDTYYWENLTPDEFKDILRKWTDHLDLEEKDYTFIHNLIYGAIEFAEEAGLEPVREFAKTSYILEEDDENIPLMEFEFGKNGKYLLIISENGKEKLYIKKLQERLGDDFDYIYNYDFDQIDNEDEDEDE